MAILSTTKKFILLTIVAQITILISLVENATSLQIIPVTSHFHIPVQPRSSCHVHCRRPWGTVTRADTTLAPLHARRRRDRGEEEDSDTPDIDIERTRNSNTATQIISPIEQTIDALCTTIDVFSLRIPLFFPLSILSLNVLLDTSTVILFDVSLAVFYTLIQQIRNEDDDDDNSGGDVILDTVALFGAFVTSFILSDGGDEQSLGLGMMIPPILSSLGVLSVVGFIISQFQSNSGDGVKGEEGKRINKSTSMDIDADPSTRLMELWDEKLSREERDKKEDKG